MRRFFVGLAVATSLLTPAPAALPAAQAQDSGLIIECDRVILNPDGTVDETATKRCGIETFVAQFVRLAQWGLTIVVFIAALMLVYGGFEFITAGGRQSKISSGQNIITGTVIGLLISLSAYVIINFAVGAITGTKTSANPFTAIATVFGRPELTNQNLVRPFSGNGDQKESPRCRTDWNTTCDSEVYCADEAQLGTSGRVANYQTRLKTLGCCPGTVDGCYGKDTTQCVRRFQVANDLVPTGTITDATKTALEQANPQRCDDPTNKARITATLDAVPATVLPSSSLQTADGCCVVRAQVGETATPLYCINDISERACATLGPNYVFATGQCAQADTTKSLCGFCRSSANDCFEEVGQYWCESVANNTDGSGMTFQSGVCRGGGICSGYCRDTLRATP